MRSGWLQMVWLMKDCSDPCIKGGSWCSGMLARAFRMRSQYSMRISSPETVICSVPTYTFVVIDNREFDSVFFV